MSTNPVLYSFRRCPYAMRARIALLYAGITVELREVVLRDKPQAMLDASPKGTVPVMVLPDGTVLEESLDIMHWALNQNDPDGWLTDDEDTKTLITRNDGPFKKALDRFKYPARYPDEDCSGAQEEVRKVFEDLNQRLTNNNYLITDKISLADIALFPFIRQASKVDEDWFQSLGTEHLYAWLNTFLESRLFKQAMVKHTPWKPGDPTVIFPSS